MLTKLYLNSTKIHEIFESAYFTHKIKKNLRFSLFCLFCIENFHLVSTGF
jgi:hypothetical protein